MGLLQSKCAAGFPLDGEKPCKECGARVNEPCGRLERIKPDAPASVTRREWGDA
jgi:hypothetical protein